ncbi:MAG: hypothetical protein WBE04_02720, partial [Methyloceanibacter sp.]
RPSIMMMMAKDAICRGVNPSIESLFWEIDGDTHRHCPFQESSDGGHVAGQKRRTPRRFQERTDRGESPRYFGCRFAHLAQTSDGLGQSSFFSQWEAICAIT